MTEQITATIAQDTPLFIDETIEETADETIEMHLTMPDALDHIVNAMIDELQREMLRLVDECQNELQDLLGKLKQLGAEVDRLTSQGSEEEGGA